MTNDNFFDDLYVRLIIYKELMPEEALMQILRKRGKLKELVDN
jgi:hypothetical protein